MREGSVTAEFVPEPSWKTLYRLGAVAVVLYLVLGMIVPALLYMSKKYDTSMNGEAILRFIAANRAWWILTQSFILFPSVFAIVAFLALFVALKQLHKSFALIGVTLCIASQVLFLAYIPVLNG